MTSFREFTGRSGRQQREVGRLLGEVKCNYSKHFFTTPLKSPCPNLVNSYKAVGYLFLSILTIGVLHTCDFLISEASPCISVNFEWRTFTNMSYYNLCGIGSQHSNISKRKKRGGGLHIKVTGTQGRQK